MKAYIGYDCMDECAEIVFAETQGRAKALIANEFDMEYVDVRVKRQPQFDKYAENGTVPKAALLADGWWFECASCRDTVRQEDLSEGAEVIDDKVYCADCADQRRTQKAVDIVSGED